MFSPRLSRTAKHGTSLPIRFITGYSCVASSTALASELNRRKNPMNNHEFPNRDRMCVVGRHVIGWHAPRTSLSYVSCERHTP